jgi:U32 family peptidase
LKGPAYVASAVAHYRQAVAAAIGLPAPVTASEIPTDAGHLYLSYSRGASPGFLGGTDHQQLVEGRFGRARGLPLGRVVSVRGSDVLVETDAAQRPSSGGKALDDVTVEVAHGAARYADNPCAPPSATVTPEPGMGAVFDAGRPNEAEQGGPIFAAAPWRSPAGKPGFALRFGQPGPDLTRVEPGNWVWINSSPELVKIGARAAAAGALALGRLAVQISVAGQVGELLKVSATAMSGIRTLRASATSVIALAAASGQGLTAALLNDKLGSMGGTAFHTSIMDTTQLAVSAHLPVSALKELRRQIVAQLDSQLATPSRSIIEPSLLAGQWSRQPETLSSPSGPPLLVPLCRTDEQLDAVLEAGATEVELDWMEFVGLGKAVARARSLGAKVVIATTRVQKPTEEKLDAHIAKLRPDGVLVRSWGSLAYFQSLPSDQRPMLHGDFSLNVTNSMTARWVLTQGLSTITAAHDLDALQLAAVLDAGPAHQFGVTVHHHIPTFHTEHCVYAHLLSTGKDFRTCGRPCESHRVSLRDRVGMVHPVIVDVGCRNTIFNAQAQSAAKLVGDLVNRGIARLRIELVRETAAETTRVWSAYQALLAGTATAVQTLAGIASAEQFGITSGTMRTLTVLQ